MGIFEMPISLPIRSAGPLERFTLLQEVVKEIIREMIGKSRASVRVGVADSLAREGDSSARRTVANNRNELDLGLRTTVVVDR
jgi:DNA-directed RNA polymerase specialized sigma54-like protein